MTLRFLLDTNIVSDAMRPRANAQLAAWILEHQGELATAAPVWHELWFGCHRLSPSARQATLEEYLTTVVAVILPILPYHERAAGWHARERARLVTAGQTPPFIDGQIAAIAATNHLTLVTYNAADFRAFAGLTLMDWAY